MIRAGRRHLVRTLADLAAQQGIQHQSYLNQGYHQADGFPDPISSPRARTRLYDAEQVDAHLTGKPRPRSRPRTTTRTCWTAGKPPPSSASPPAPGTPTNPTRSSPGT